MVHKNIFLHTCSYKCHLTVYLFLLQVFLDPPTKKEAHEVLLFQFHSFVHHLYADQIEQDGTHDIRSARKAHEQPEH